MKKKVDLTNFSVLEMVYARIKDFFGAKVVESDQRLTAVFDWVDDREEIHYAYMNYEEVVFINLNSQIYFFGLGRKAQGHDKVAAGEMDLFFVSAKKFMSCYWNISERMRKQNKDLSEMSIKEIFEFIAVGSPIDLYGHYGILISALGDKRTFCLPGREPLEISTDDEVLYNKAFVDYMTDAVIKHIQRWIERK